MRVFIVKNVRTVFLYVSFVPSVQSSRETSIIGGYQTEAHLQSSEASKMERLKEICKPVTIFVKNFILDFLQGFEYALQPCFNPKKQNAAYIFLYYWYRFFLTLK